MDGEFDHAKYADPMLTLSQAAKLVGKSVPGVSLWISRGLNGRQLPTQRQFRNSNLTHLIRLADLARFTAKPSTPERRLAFLREELGLPARPAGYVDLFDWHDAPTGEGCSLCGFAAGRARSHRRVADEEAIEAVWIGRTDTAAGWQEQAFGTRVLQRANRSETPSKDPDDWHLKPVGKANRQCVICGAPSATTGQHRRELDGERTIWVSRKKASGEWSYKRFGDPPRRATNGQKIHPYLVPTDATLERLGLAATLEAVGTPWEQIVERVGATWQTIRTWKHRYRPAWNEAVDLAMPGMINIVRSVAGTERVLADVEAYWGMADGAYRWSKAKGQSLFDQAGLTLSRFYAEHYQPTFLSTASPKTPEGYASVVKAWALLTGDPPLSEISNQTMNLFRDARSKRPGKDRCNRVSPNSVRKHLKHLDALLRKAEKPSSRNRDALGLIDAAPWTKPPRALLRPPRLVDLGLIDATYMAAVGMDWPNVPGFKSPAWWRLLLVLAYNLGLRRRTLFSLRCDSIDWRASAIIVPPEQTKTGLGQIVPLNATVLEHLQAARSNREHVLPRPSRTWATFYERFRKLQAMAGIDRRSQFLLHDLRKTLATELWDVSPQAAQLMLGHTASSTTTKFYVQGRGILARAAAELRQPDSFRTAI